MASAKPVITKHTGTALNSWGVVYAHQQLPGG